MGCSPSNHADEKIADKPRAGSVERQVFGSKKYDKAWDLIAKLGSEHTQTITEKGTAFVEGWNKLLDAFEEECFNKDRTHLDYEKVFQGGKAPEAVREVFFALQDNEAQALCHAVASVADIAFMTFVTDEIHPLEAVLATEEQSVPVDFEGKKFGEIVHYKELSDEARETVDAAHSLVFGHVMDQQVLFQLAKQQNHPGVIAHVQSGALSSQGSAPHHGDSKDALFLSRILYSHPETCMSGEAGALINHLEYLYCQNLILSKEFHQDMRALLSPFGEYSAARMKGYGRGEAKCKDAADGYRNKTTPQSKHLKDVLRCTLYVQNNAKLEGARASLVAAYGDHGVKDRRKQEPKDVLQVVRYKHLLVEVQFHFEAVAALKVISHAAYGILRCDKEEWQQSMNTLFDRLSIYSLMEDPSSYKGVNAIPMTPGDFRTKYCRLHLERIHKGKNTE